MKLSFSVVALFAALVATTAAAPIPIPQNVPVPTTATCKRIDIRRNIADLTTAQRDTFFNAIQKLKDTPDPTLGDASIYDKYVKMHIDYQIEGHGNSQFIPWHRLFLREFELELQKVEPSVVIPYWDWSVSSQAPERSIVFTQDYLGGTGSGTSRCVTSGRFANWQVRYPQRGCLQRNFDGGDKIGAFTAPELLDEMIYQSNSYEDFTTKLEYGVHGRVHNGVGGTMSQMQSNSDPIFYLHHANVDRMWSMYQSRSDQHAVEYNGQRPANRGAANLDDILTPFNKTVREALDIVNNLCYTYTKQDIPTPVGQPTLTPTATPTVAVPVVTPTPAVPTPVITAHASPTPATSTPAVPTPATPTPAVPTPATPTPAIPTPATPTPAIPTPATPTPAIPTPTTPTPAIPTPVTPTPAIPTPATPTPAIPTPAVPTPAITTSAIPTTATATPVTTPATPKATPTGTAATPIPTGAPTVQPTPVPSSTPVPNLVDCFDRSNMEQIRMPAAIPPSWLQMNHLALDKYTAEEASLLQKVLKYNSLPFSSVGALQYYRDQPTYDFISQRVYEAYGVPVPDANTIHLTAPIGKVSFLTAGGVTAPDGGSHVNPQDLPVAADPSSRTSGASSSVVSGIPLAASVLAAVVIFRL